MFYSVWMYIYMCVCVHPRKTYIQFSPFDQYYQYWNVRAKALVDDTLELPWLDPYDWCLKPYVWWLKLNPDVRELHPYFFNFNPLIVDGSMNIFFILLHGH